MMVTEEWYEAWKTCQSVLVKSSQVKSSMWLPRHCEGEGRGGEEGRDWNVVAGRLTYGTILS